MQFVQSVPVAEVLATEGNIQVGRNNHDTVSFYTTWPDLLITSFISTELLQEARTEWKGALRHQLGGDGHLC